MSKETTTTYTCDYCNKEIEAMYGPIFFAWASRTEPQMNRAGEACSPECLQELVKRCLIVTKDDYFKQRGRK